ncbi:hypothetical protein M885DRAFT_569994 [Pelagophyceae sp. CCMP2097]|nr:hypothetical protein M885DRAFT_569994 [Pelagophyceae sp. CCMP2097]
MGMTGDQATHMPDVLHSLHEKSLVDLCGNLAKTYLHVVSAAEMPLGSSATTVVTEVYFDVEALNQAQQSAVLRFVDVPMLVQEMLNDTRIPKEDWFLEQDAPEYEDEQGHAVYGPVSYQCDRFKELLKTRTNRHTVVLEIIIWEDKSGTSVGSLHPLVFTLGNLAPQSRLRDAGMRTLALLPVIDVRTGYKLSPAQRAVRDQVTMDALATALSSANASAGGLYLVLPGDDKPTLCELRLAEMIGDKQEDSTLTATVGGHCPRSYAVTCARVRERGVLRPRPYLRVDEDCCSATAEPRTADKELDRQALYFQLAGLLKKAAAAELSRANEQNALVKVTINDLRRLLPPSLGGVTQITAVDCMYVINLGTTLKFWLMEEALIARSFLKSPALANLADVRLLLERRLQLVPKMCDGTGAILTRFEHGPWMSGNDISGASEWAAFFSQVLVCILGDEQLIPDATTRRRLTTLHCAYYAIY